MATLGAFDTDKMKRTSNTEEDAVHKRASLVLQMANSLESSNTRRKRQLQQIESGLTDNVQQMIDDIMHEKPVSLLDLLKEAEPQALPSTKELKERYEKKAKEDSEDDENEDEDDDEEGKTDEEDEDKKEDDVDKFNTKQDEIVNKAIAPALIDSNIPQETLQAHTAPLQEQLKRSYEAIVKLRENSDLRYQALEKKYRELKREKLDNPDAFKGDATDNTTENTEGVHREQLTVAYEAIVRLRENADLRYNVLESKYLDLKREHAEADARNGRLETDLVTMRHELARVVNDPNASFSFEDSVLPMPLRRATYAGNMSFKLDGPPKLSAQEKAERKKEREEKKRADKQQRLFLQEFNVLCQKVEDCEECKHHIPHGTLKKVTEQLAQVMAASFNQAEEEEEEEESEGEDENNSDVDIERDEEEGDEDFFAGANAKRHQGAMALLGASWSKLAQMDEQKLEKPGGKFANLSESRAEEKLRGKKSQFVSAQSGVYCRIDHDMQNQYGDLNQFEAPPKPPLLPSPALVHHNPLDQFEEPTPPPSPPQLDEVEEFSNPPSPPPSPIAVVVTHKQLDQIEEPSKPPSTPLVLPAVRVRPDPEEHFEAPSKAPIPPRVRSDPPGVASGERIVHAPTPLESEMSLRKAVKAFAHRDPPVETIQFPDSPVPSDLEQNHAAVEALEPPADAATEKKPSPVFLPNTQDVAGGASVKSSPDAASALTRRDSEQIVPSKSALKSVRAKKPVDRRKSAGKAVSFSELVAADEFKEPVDSEPPQEEEKEKEQLKEEPPTPDFSTLSPKVALAPRDTEAPEREEENVSETVGPSLTTSTAASPESSGGTSSARRAPDGRLQRIPSFRLEPAERKARTDAALKQAKEVAKNVRKQQKSNTKLQTDSEDNSSVISGISNVSSLVEDKKSKGLFKNPFRRKSKISEAANGTPQVISEEVPLHQKPSSSLKQFANVVTEKNSPRRQSSPVISLPSEIVMVAPSKKQQERKSMVISASVEC